MVLLCKHYLSSSELSQIPCVLAYDPDLKVPGDRPLDLQTRVPFSAKQKKEFQKTAEAISAAPWFLHDATAYMLKLLQDNADMQGDHWAPPHCDWGLGQPQAQPKKRPVEEPNTVPQDALKFAERAPAPVVVTAKKGKGKGKQDQKGPVLEHPALPDSPSNEAASDPPSLPDAHDRENEPHPNHGGGAPPGSRGTWRSASRRVW